MKPQAVLLTKLFAQTWQNRQNPIFQLLSTLM